MPFITSPVQLHRSLVSLRNIQATLSSRFLHTSSTLPRLLNPSKLIPDAFIDNNYWPRAVRPAVAKVAKREFNHEDSGTGVPIKISVKQPRPVIKEEKKEPERYHIACQVPCEHSDKYTLHRIDPSINISQESLRPTVLKVIVPAETISDSQKYIRQEPNVFPDYPLPKKDQ